ncbi:MAG: hypothetical protein V3S71_05850, partial [Acidobacteriota bacterium]
IKIGSYPTREHLGLIFAFLGEGDVPEFPTYPDWEGIERTLDAHTRYCNYFQWLENHTDPMHNPFVHHQTWRGEGRPDVTKMPTIVSEEVEWGIQSRIIEPTGGERLYFMGMPNVHEKRRGARAGQEQGKYGDGRTVLGSISWNVPIDDESNVEFRIDPVKRDDEEKDTQQTEAYDKKIAEMVDAVISGRMKVDEAERLAASDQELGHIREGVVRGGTFNLQDGIAQVGQGLSWFTNDDQEHLGREDTCVIAFRKLWYRELQALADGKPLTRWFRPEWSYGTEEGDWRAQGSTS